MRFAEEYIIYILMHLPNECAYLDYKEIPYIKREYGNLVKDVIAMLNSEEGIGKDKAIIFGIPDETHELKGIDGFLQSAAEKFDDASYQDIFDKIAPRPALSAGILSFRGRTFGYIFASKDANREWVYEVKENVIPNQNVPPRCCAMQGQAFTRRGSKNYVMMQEDREHLKSHCGVRVLPSWPYAAPGGITSSANSLDSITVAAIIGGWCENNEADHTLIESLASKPYGSWVIPLRKLYESGESLVTFHNSFWRVSEPLRIFEQYGVQLYDGDATALEQHIKSLLLEYDPKYDLEPSQRFAASVYGKSPRYSPAVRFGIANFLAIAGNYPEFFRSMSRGRLQRVICFAIEELFASADWRVIATMEQYFQLLAEASPDFFISSVQTAVRDDRSGLCEYLTQYENGLFETNYGCNLVQALTMIACRQEYFSGACFAAFLIICKQPKHLEPLTSVLLPWTPKTEATVNQRVALVRQLFEENQVLAWKLLCSLLPGQTTASGGFVKPRYMPCKLQEQSEIPDTYYEEIERYISLAVEMNNGKTERLAFLVNMLSEVSKDAFFQILDAVKCAAESLDDRDRYDLWNKLQNLANQHRKYSQAEWALPEEALAHIDSTIESVAPKDMRFRLRRLFQQNSYDLLVTQEDDYEQTQQALLSLRKEAVEWSILTYGLEEFMLSAEEFENVYHVGECLAALDCTEEIDAHVCGWLSAENENRRRIAQDYLFCRYYTCGTEWIRKEITGISQQLTASALAALPVTDETLLLVKEFLPDGAEKQYWKAISPWGIDTDENMAKTVEKLIQCNRPLEALEIAERLHDSGHDLSNAVVYNLLEQVIKCQDIRKSSHYAHIIVTLIEYLQDNWDNQDAVALLEWQFFALFDHYGSKRPLALYRALGTDPKFFITMLCHTFKGHHEAKREISDEEGRIAEHAFDVFYKWNVFPWTNSDGTLDEEKLKSWFATVKAASIEKDRYEVAMSTIGGVFFYAPNGTDGLFIARAVAELLHNEESDFIRNGFHSVAISSRGVHFVDPTGAPEFALEKQYNEYARQIDELGLFRFAKTLRGIANEYHWEAISNIEEEKKWGSHI